MAKILFIESSEFVREVYELKFELEGFDVVLAEDGYAAHESAVRHHPDIVVLDGGHLSEDTQYFLDTFRADAEFTEVPIIMFSDHLAEADTREMAKKYAVNAFPHKLTSTPGTLVGLVRGLLGTEKPDHTATHVSDNTTHQYCADVAQAA